MSNFSKSMVKRIRALSKNELVDKLIELNNYAEHQKTMNILMLKIIDDLKAELKKHEPADNNVEPTKEQENV